MWVLSGVLLLVAAAVTANAVLAPVRLRVEALENPLVSNEEVERDG